MLRSYGFTERDLNPAQPAYYLLIIRLASNALKGGKHPQTPPLSSLLGTAHRNSLMTTMDNGRRSKDDGPGRRLLRGA